MVVVSDTSHQNIRPLVSLSAMRVIHQELCKKIHTRSCTPRSRNQRKKSWRREQMVFQIHHYLLSWSQAVIAWSAVVSCQLSVVNA